MNYLDVSDLLAVGCHLKLGARPCLKKKISKSWEDLDDT